MPRKHDDFLALDLAIKMLGGEGGNRLHRVLRSERGLTYGASADFNALKEAGDIVAETDTRSETTGETLRLIVDEFWKLQRERVQERELADAQAYLTGSFPLTIETPSAIALQVLNAVFFGLNLNDLQTYRERVNAVTADDIQRVARKYLHPDRLSIVLVGDASVFVKQLPGAGFDQFERIALSDLDLGSADLSGTVRRPTASSRPRSRCRPLAFQPQAAGAGPSAGRDGQGSQKQRAAVREVIARAVQAKGGLDKLRSIRTIKATATTTMAGGSPAPRRSTPTSSIQYPGSFRVDAKTPAGAARAGVRRRRGLGPGRSRRRGRPRGRSRPDAQHRAARLDRAAPGACRRQGRRRRAFRRRRTGPRSDGAGRRRRACRRSPAARSRDRSDPRAALRHGRPGGARSGGGAVHRLPQRRRPPGAVHHRSAADGRPVLTRRVHTVELNVPLAADLFTRPS